MSKRKLNAGPQFAGKNFPEMIHRVAGLIRKAGDGQAVPVVQSMLRALTEHAVAAGLDAMVFLKGLHIDYFVLLAKVAGEPAFFQDLTLTAGVALLQKQLREAGESAIREHLYQAMDAAILQEVDPLKSYREQISLEVVELGKIYATDPKRRELIRDLTGGNRGNGGKA